MRGLWGRWVALLSRQEGGDSLAIFRIAVGLVGIYSVATVAWSGMVPVLWMDQKYGGYQEISKSWWLVDQLGGPTPTVIWGLVAVALLSSLLLALGLASRLSAFVALQAFLALTWANAAAGGSYDDLISNALWLLVLADSSATLSLRSRLRTGSWRSDAQVPAWPRYLIIGQIVVVYLTTAMQKLSAYWTPGGDYSALYYILQQPTWQRVDMRWVAPFFPLTQLMTAATWFWELGSPVLLLALWYRDTRTRPGRLRALFNRLDLRALYCAFGVLLHLGIFALMEVGPFTWITLSYYLALWSPDEWRALTRRRGRAAPSRPGSSAPRTGSPLPASAD